MFILIFNIFYYLIYKRQILFLEQATWNFYIEVLICLDTQNNVRIPILDRRGDEKSREFMNNRIHYAKDIKPAHYNFVQHHLLLKIVFHSFSVPHYYRNDTIQIECPFTFIRNIIIEIEIKSMDVWKNMKTLYLKPPTKLLKEIVNFENNPFLYKISKEQLVYEFPLKECISLEYLMYAFEHKFIQIFRGQALLIVQMIIMHYIDMRSQKIDHGNLSSANIWIHVGGTGRFSTYARKQEFLKIYFVNYQGECTSEKDEGKSLGLSLNEFLALFDKDSHENWKYFQNKISNCEMIGDYLYVVSSINDFIEKNMDLKKQMLKSNFDYKEVGYLSNRYRAEIENKEHIKSILTYEQTEVIGGEEDILFTPLYQYLVQILTNFRMKEIIKDFGKALENKYSGVGAKDIDFCLNRINPICWQFFKIVENKLFNKEQLDKGVQQLKEFIKSFNEEIEQNYKLDIQITKDPQQIVLDSWVVWIQTNLVDDPTILLQKKIETLKEDIHKNSRDAYINMYIDLFVKGSEKLVEELL